jgi:hypothetical protein
MGMPMMMKTRKNNSDDFITALHPLCALVTQHSIGLYCRHEHGASQPPPAPAPAKGIYSHIDLNRQRLVNVCFAPDCEHLIR